MSKVIWGIVGLIIVAAVVAFFVLRTPQTTPSSTSSRNATTSPATTGVTTPAATTSTSTAITAKPASTPTTAATSSSTQTAAKVSYTDSGFSPASITVKSGTTVTFTNTSSQSMWVASDPHPIHTGLAGFDERASVEKGGTYSFTFTKVGSFGYHNHLNPSDTGTVVVQ
ncbi:cupredoxin domain-containing protein [Candidatus Berkelbacteria bacterium]|nr:cupredoxin domain-containing protein [Candidatus Berkelbacteria bacterium]